MTPEPGKLIIEGYADSHATAVYIRWYGKGDRHVGQAYSNEVSKGLKLERYINTVGFKDSWEEEYVLGFWPIEDMCNSTQRLQEDCGT